MANEKELFENNQEEEMEMELEMDGEEVEKEMEELVAEKVKDEEKKRKENKSKRGPKAGSKKEKPESDKAEKKPKKEKETDLNNPTVLEREIKKGRVSAPQAMIAKLEDGTYMMRVVKDGAVLLKEDFTAADYKDVEPTPKMQEGKSAITLMVAKMLGSEKFKGITKDGKEKEHDYVRVELVKPGREKNVVELYSVTWAKTQQKEAVEKAKRKEERTAKEEAKKEAEKKEEQSA